MTWMTFVRHGFLLFFSSPCHVQAMEGGLVLWQVSHMKEFFRSRAKLMSPLLAGSKFVFRSDLMCKNLRREKLIP